VSKVDVDISGITKLLKALGEVPETRIGVLGNKDERKREKGSGKTPTNAEIGSFHEFGLGQPKRSFLRMPLIEHLESEALKEKDALRESFEQAAEGDGLNALMNTLGAIGVEVVKTAFDTQGYGKWVKWKTPGYQNNTGKILNDTLQLRDSIAHEVD